MVQGLNDFRREVEGYAKKHGEKPIGIFLDVKDTKKSMEGIIARDGYFFNDIKFEIPAVNKGGKPDPTRFGFIPYQNVDLPRWAVGDIIADYFKAGFKVGDPKKTPQYKRAMNSAKEDIYRFASKV